MSSLLAVRDLDCIKSFSPLAFDLSAVEVTGAAAILRRILYRWVTPAGALRYARSVGLAKAVTDLEATTMSARDLSGLRDALEREGNDVDFVVACRVTVSLLSGVLRIRALVTLADGQTYPLEVTAGDASVALLALGVAA